MDDAALDGARFRTAERFDHRGEIGLLRPPATINRTLPNLIGASVFQAFLGRAVERFEGTIEFLQQCLDIDGERRRGAADRLRFLRHAVVAEVAGHPSNVVVTEYRKTVMWGKGV